MPRLFIAIDFPEAVRDRLAALPVGVRGARLLPTEQYHLTLRFIGEVEGTVFTEIAEALGDLSAASFDLRLSGVGHFPPNGQPKVLWAGVAESEPLRQLQDHIETCLRGLGLAPDSQNYTPHVTLARLKYGKINRIREFLVEHNDFTTDDIPIAAFNLYSSTLGEKGAVHTLEASYPLN
jgi:RNA 2',3'-cyclic 3'-phosphodiesterase